MGDQFISKLEMDVSESVCGAPIGLDCWDDCNKQQGPCEWCGSEGYCCKIGMIGNGCDGTFGGDKVHKCVFEPISKLI